MIVGIKVSGFEEVEKISLKEERRRILGVSNLIFDKVVEEGRDEVLMRLMGKFRGLNYEDLEEVYDDGCLVLWEKMMDKDFVLREKSVLGYLLRICWNIGMHYLRKVKDDVLSLDMMLESGFRGMEDDGSGLMEMFEVLEEQSSKEEKLKKLEEVWKKLKEVDRMILECYHVEGCRMEEIAKRIGYRNGNSVKSKKCKVLKKMLEMMNEGEEDFKGLSLVA